MLVKIHKSYRSVVSICDSDLIGRRFEEGKFQLDLTGEFFKGEKKDEEETREIIEDLAKEDSTFNIVGKKAVDLALSCRVISREGVRKINGIPFALVLL